MHRHPPLKTASQWLLWILYQRSYALTEALLSGMIRLKVARFMHPSSNWMKGTCLRNRGLWVRILPGALFGEEKSGDASRTPRSRVWQRLVPTEIPTTELNEELFTMFWGGGLSVLGHQSLTLEVSGSSPDHPIVLLNLSGRCCGEAYEMIRDTRFCRS